MDFLGDSDSDDGAVEQEQLLPLDDEASRAAALQLRPAGSGVLAFHSGIEEAMLLFVERVATSGDPKSVLLAVDNYCYSRHWMMHVGDIKGNMVDGVLTASQQRNSAIPNCCAVEIGSYCGYSALRISSRLNGHETLYSIENNARCREWTRRLVAKAGLSENVVIVSTTEEALTKIRTAEQCISFLFIDHAKERYVEDLKLFEQSGVMLSPGCTVVADNILSFNSPLQEYIDHVSDEAKYTNYELLKGPVEYSGAGLAGTSDTGTVGLEDGIAISIWK